MKKLETKDGLRRGESKQSLSGSRRENWITKHKSISQLSSTGSCSNPFVALLSVLCKCKLFKGLQDSLISRNRTCVIYSRSFADVMRCCTLCLNQQTVRSLSILKSAFGISCIPENRDNLFGWVKQVKRELLTKGKRRSWMSK